MAKVAATLEPAEALELPSAASVLLASPREVGPAPVQGASAIIGGPRWLTTGPAIAPPSFGA